MVVIALSLLFPERSIDADERRRGVFASCVAVAICIDTREDWVTLVGREGGVGTGETLTPALPSLVQSVFYHASVLRKE